MIRMGGDDLFGRWSDQILKIDQEVIIVAPVSPVIMIDELIFEIFWNFKPESIWPRIHFLLVPTFTLAASLFHFSRLEIAHWSLNNFQNSKMTSTLKISTFQYQFWFLKKSPFSA